MPVDVVSKATSESEQWVYYATGKASFIHVREEGGIGKNVDIELRYNAVFTHNAEVCCK